MKDGFQSVFDGTIVVIPNRSLFSNRRFYALFWQKKKEYLAGMGSHREIVDALCLVDEAYDGGTNFRFLEGALWEPAGIGDVLAGDGKDFIKMFLKSNEEGSGPLHRCGEIEALLYLAAYPHVARIVKEAYDKQ